MAFEPKIIGLKRSCPVCSNGEGRVLGIMDYAMFPDAPIAPRFEITACSHCGLVTGNTPSTQNDYFRYYAQNNYSPSYFDRVLNADELEYISDSVDIVSRHVADSHSTIVDIGCGVGHLLEGLARSGFKNIAGLDASHDCVDFLKKKGIQAYHGSLGSAMPVQADLITLYHVVEHLLDIPGTLDRLAAMIQPGSRLLVEVPDTARFADYADGKPLGYFYFTHLLHLDHVHLVNLFTSRGMKCLDSGKRLRREEGLEMPCVWAVFEKSSEKEYRPDFSLSAAIRTWFETTDLDPKGELEDLQRSGRHVYIWGIGMHTQMYLKMSPLKQCNIKALVDKNPGLHGSILGGRKVEPLSILEDAGPDEAVFIGTVVHKKTMADYLDKIGFTGQVITI